MDCDAAQPDGFVSLLSGAPSAECYDAPCRLSNECERGNIRAEPGLAEGQIVWFMRRMFACRVEIGRHSGLLLFTPDVIKVAPERNNGGELKRSVFKGGYGMQAFWKSNLKLARLGWRPIYGCSDAANDAVLSGRRRA